MENDNNNCIQNVKQLCDIWIDKMLDGDLTLTKPGSISYMLYGEKPSEQSINIKLGKLGEYLSKELIKTNDDFELLLCGVQLVNNKKKDIDLLFKDKVNKIIYYRELHLCIF